MKWSRALCHIKLNWVSEHCDSMDTACLCATHTRVDSVAKICQSSCFWKDPEVLLSFSWGGQTVFILYLFWGTKVWSVKAILAFSHNWPEWTESCVCPLVKFDKCFLFRLKLLKYWDHLDRDWKKRKLLRRTLNLLREAWRTVPDDYFKTLHKSLPQRGQSVMKIKMV